MNFCYTGKIAETRKEIQDYIEGFGHTFQKKVSWETDVLVVGERGAGFKDPESKKEKEAISFGIRIVRVSKLDDMLEYFI